jgi:hypothetical protein
MQRVWLSAEANGVGVHPMTGFLYWLEPMTTLRERIAHFDSPGTGFPATESQELLKLREDFLGCFPPVEGAEILFFRLVRTTGDLSLRSLRRPSAETLSIT